MHPTLLPQGRGRASIPWAIIKGLSRTGVTLFKLEEGVDTGPILKQRVLEIAGDETATSLYQRVAETHRALIGDIWNDLSADEVSFQPQDEKKASEWPARTHEDGRIHPNMSMTEVDRLVRGTTRPYPGAFIDMDGVRLRVWKGCEDKTGHEVTENNETPLPRIELSDGIYLITDFDVEPLST
jgi:methionyl-tRNA formyltransferase